ncbi:DNA mismatch endonuclease Vsr [Nocardioides sp. zg-579]|uniref:DNA mismatch endonuclease Vsr n=2 Tax=Nocardioides marmotae TaxID=2663857 RepID=A0A6I3J7H7_9ACTN|nr:DNA mismatch endonuclease Vsr [Gordonia jinghuaiqii]MTB93979.1 DNA mismatch endonuclease Vsr [Nocardioides marmotae]QKE00293.1 very short patch repair endonuclease [Nocardioides marmotae]
MLIWSCTTPLLSPGAAAGRTLRVNVYPVDGYGRVGGVSTPEPPRRPPSGALSAKMSTLARQDTAPEMALRRELHRRGLRFRVQMKVPGNNRRTIDIAFTRARLAVYVDGCFWHGCPQHHHQPRSNPEWWRWKIERNQARDRDTNRELMQAGWQVLRVWEHAPVPDAADLVENTRSRILDSGPAEGSEP